MLKRHQACIDLSKDALIIAGREIPFLPERELPPYARIGATEEDIEAAIKASAENAAAGQSTSGK
ncbi:hypothetical protein BDF19DRAFT_269223 [Syncephalis fuscata]|nr:hypothetical protein BDF19DRAFT_269223 [Syncephalis fuscata]